MISPINSVIIPYFPIQEYSRSLHSSYTLPDAVSDQDSGQKEPFVEPRPSLVEKTDQMGVKTLRRQVPLFSRNLSDSLLLTRLHHTHRSQEVDFVSHLSSVRYSDDEVQYYIQEVNLTPRSPIESGKGLLFILGGGYKGEFCNLCSTIASTIAHITTQTNRTLAKLEDKLTEYMRYWKASSRKVADSRRSLTVFVKCLDTVYACTTGCSYLLISHGDGFYDLGQVGYRIQQPNNASDELPSYVSDPFNHVPFYDKITTITIQATTTAHASHDFLVLVHGVRGKSELNGLFSLFSHVNPLRPSKLAHDCVDVLVKSQERVPFAVQILSMLDPNKKMSVGGLSMSGSIQVGDSPCVREERVCITHNSVFTENRYTEVEEDLQGESVLAAGAIMKDKTALSRMSETMFPFDCESVMSETTAEESLSRMNSGLASTPSELDIAILSPQISYHELPDSAMPSSMASESSTEITPSIEETTPAFSEISSMVSAPRALSSLQTTLPSGPLRFFTGVQDKHAYRDTKLPSHRGKVFYVKLKPQVDTKFLVASRVRSSPKTTLPSGALRFFTGVHDKRACRGTQPSSHGGSVISNRE